MRTYIIFTETELWARARRMVSRAVVGLLGLAAGGWFAGDLPGAGAPKATNSPTEFSAFKKVYENNIFNPNRRPNRRGAGDRPERTPKIESFALIGTFLDDHQLVAFFTGTESSYRKALLPPKSIAGFQLVEVEYGCVKLSRTNHVFEFPIGSQMRRQDEGEWELVQGASAASSSSESGGEADKSSAVKSTGDAATDAILKRLMEKREKD
jgi:hypothetical protein